MIIILFPDFNFYKSMFFFLWTFYLCEVSHSFIIPKKSFEANLKSHSDHEGMSFILMINRNRRRRMFLTNLSESPSKIVSFLLDICINNILSFPKGNDATRLLPSLQSSSHFLSNSFLVDMINLLSSATHILLDQGYAFSKWVTQEECVNILTRD